MKLVGSDAGFVRVSPRCQRKLTAGHLFFYPGQFISVAILKKPMATT